MRRLAVQQGDNRERGQQAARDDRGGVPDSSNRSLVRDSDLDSVLFLQALPLVSDDHCCSAGVGVRKIAGANPAIASDLAIRPADFFSAEYRGQSTGGGSRGSGKLVIGRYYREGVASIDLDDSRPGNLDGAQHIHEGYRGIVYLDRWTPQPGPAYKGEKCNTRQVLASALKASHCYCDGASEAEYPNDNRDHLVEAGVKHPSIVAGEGA